MDDSISSKIMELMAHKDVKETLATAIYKDKDFRGLFFWFLGAVGVLIITLFLSRLAALGVFILLLSLSRVLFTFANTKVVSMMNMLSQIKTESETITYNKNLTNAINLLFHNNRDMRELGKEIIFTEFPQHSDVVLSADRIFEDSEPELEESYVSHVRVAARLN